MLLITAVVNLFTKYQATIAGVIFSAVFFTIFTLSERHVAKERHGKPEQLDQFRVYGNQELGSGAMGVRPGNILVAVRDPRNLYYLRHVLSQTNTTKQDVVVMSARLYHREHTFSGSRVMDASQVFDHYEQELFTAAVAVGRKGREADFSSRRSRPQTFSRRSWRRPGGWIQSEWSAASPTS